MNEAIARLDIDEVSSFQIRRYTPSIDMEKISHHDFIVPSAANCHGLFEHEMIAKSAKSDWQRHALSEADSDGSAITGLRASVSFIAEQEWEGEVIRIEEDRFLGRLHDLSEWNDASFCEETEFSLKEISETDLSLLKEGAIFRWSLGFSRTPAGTRERTSRIVFRRLPAWTKKDLALSTQRAEELWKSIEWDD